MIKKILIGLAVVVVVFVIVVALQSPTYRVQRTAVMAAPPAAVFEQVNDFRKWKAWSPWEKLDPEMKTTFEGPASGTGAIYSWTGNSDVGEGKMTITESRPPELVRIKLEFFKPMAGVSDTEFTFKAQGNQTETSWTMSGTNNFIGKAMCLIMNMDKTVGGEFEKGLAAMKTAAEAAAKQ